MRKFNLGLFFIILLCLSVSSNSYGLTKQEAQDQLTKRNAVLKEIKDNETNLIPNQKPLMPVIAIMLSKSCIWQIKNNLNTNCPNYKKLENKFDTTNKKYTGFFFDDHGFYHRGKGLKSSYFVYKNSKEFVICVDCPYNDLIASKVITIESNPFNYTKESDKKIINGVRYEYQNKGIESCRYATVSPDMDLIKDTIDYLANNCIKTNFNEKVTIKIKQTPIGDLMQFKQYQHDKWLKEAKLKALELAKLKCKKSCQTPMKH